MDEVDAQQQLAIEENNAIDIKQQGQIDRLMANQGLMFVLLIINAIGSIAQIIECVKIWTSLK